MGPPEAGQRPSAERRQDVKAYLPGPPPAWAASVICPADLVDVAAPPYRPPWMTDALCREYPNVQFVLPLPQTKKIADEARAICAVCLCQDECLAFALADPHLVGIRGGTTTAERRALRPESAA